MTSTATVRRLSVNGWLLLAGLAISAGGLGGSVDAAERVSIEFAAIAGATRWNHAASTWELAHAGASQLFVDGRTVAVFATGKKLTPNAPPIELLRLAGLRPGISFTCALKLANSDGGVVSLSCQAAGAQAVSSGADDQRASTFGADGWIDISLCVPSSTNATIDAFLTVSSSGAVMVECAVVHRPFAQLFYHDTSAPLTGAAYRQFGSDGTMSPGLSPGVYLSPLTKQWATPPPDMVDGVRVAQLTTSYQSLLSVGRGETVGVPLPTRVTGGAWLAWRGKGRYQLLLEHDGSCEQTGSKPRPELRDVGRAREWRAESLSLDATRLDTNNDGLWSGYYYYSWESANSLVRNYGEGSVDYLVLLPQNRMPLTPPGAGRLSFVYQATGGQWKDFFATAPPEARAAALTHIADQRTRLWWETPQGWQTAEEIGDSAYPNLLAVKERSILWTGP